MFKLKYVLLAVMVVGLAVYGLFSLRSEKPIVDTAVPKNDSKFSPSITSSPTNQTDGVLITDADFTKLSIYKSQALGFEISYPTQWKTSEKNVDEYDERKTYIPNATRFPHDKYSLASMGARLSELTPGINSLMVVVYPNPNNLSLYDYFKGRTEFLGEQADYPNDIGHSEQIKSGRAVKFSGYDGMLLADASYSDMGFVRDRVIYIPMTNKIYSVKIEYITGEGFNVNPEQKDNIVDKFSDIVEKGFVIY